MAKALQVHFRRPRHLGERQCGTYIKPDERTAYGLQ